MASLATHFSAAILLLPVGIRRLFTSSSLYLNNPSQFRSKVWYFSDPKWKNLDFFILTVALPIASFSELFLFLSFPSHPTYRFAFLHQSLILFLFWAMTLLFLLRDCVSPLLINESILFALSGVVFLLESSIIGSGVSGLVSSVIYGWSADLTIVCGFCCLYLAIKPSAFFAEFCLSCGLIFKGTWLLQTGLSMYTDFFAFKGCPKIVLSPSHGNAELNCVLDQDAFRGEALASLLFLGHSIFVLLLSFGVFGLFSSDNRFRYRETSGPLLAGLDSENRVLRTIGESEFE
ncbi:hypothetical protein LINPERPRIM_LOCUS16896 [Linum perenne]